MSELKPIFENWNVEIKRSLEPYDSIVFMSEHGHGTSEITDVELNTIERAFQFMTLFLIDNGRPDLKAELVEAIESITVRTNSTMGTGVEPVSYIEKRKVLEAINTIIGESLCEHGKSMTDYCEPCGRINNA